MGQRVESVSGAGSRGAVKRWCLLGAQYFAFVVFVYVCRACVCRLLSGSCVPIEVTVSRRLCAPVMCLCVPVCVHAWV